ncbi:signal peptidase I [Pelagibius sp.]|uniref:signal peptidase I n=1 Tax=Pelagibius sp. TaxID=1931238 RepID=UPI0026245B08|nr:signal peptidase I [Pelagibius sp.]
MISAFRTRRPGAVALIALVFGPSIVMLFVGRGWLAVGYLLVTFALLPAPFLAAHFELLPLAAETAMMLLLVAVQLIGVVHGYRIAVRLSGLAPVAWYARWYFVAGAVLVFGYGMPLVTRSYLWEPFNIPSSSMEPTLLRGDYLFVSKYAYGTERGPDRGDVAAFAVPAQDGQPFLKRIVGLPGDRIQMRDGVLYINDSPVDLEPLDTVQPGAPLDPAQLYRETLPNGRSHLIQEYTDAARYDSTEIFEVPSGQYFALGDNRDNSIDSRMLEHFGYIPLESLIGRLAVVLWNSERQKLVFLEDD